MSDERFLFISSDSRNRQRAQVRCDNMKLTIELIDPELGSSTIDCKETPTYPDHTHPIIRQLIDHWYQLEQQPLYQLLNWNDDNSISKKLYMKTGYQTFI